MPQMGVSVAEGTVVEWRKRVGDWVTADEVIASISTDKIDTDVESPASGRVQEILIDVGTTVDVGTVLARIATDARPGEPHVSEGDEGPAAEGGERDAGGASTGSAEAGTREAAAAPRAPGEAGELKGDTEADHSATAQRGSPAARETASTRPRRRYSPVVMRIAAEHDIDLDRVKGTGRGGRGRQPDRPAFTAGDSAAGAEEPPMHIESPYQPDAPAPPKKREPRFAAPEPQAAPAPAAAGDLGPAQSGPLSRMRQSIGRHMLESLHTAATCTTVIEADMTRLEAARKKLGVTALPLVARATIDTLREFPSLNATLEGETFTQYEAVHLGIAVSLGSGGLIVPVIQHAQDLAVEGLAKRIKDLARRARDNQLTPDEVRGGTFTITNPGGYGSIIATPVINQPQVAILDTEAIVKRPVVITDELGNDAIAIRSMTYLCMSWDHRALDGAIAAQFLAGLRARLEAWPLD